MEGVSCGGKLKRNCLVIREGYRLAAGDVPLEASFDAIGGPRRKFKATVGSNTFASIYLDLSAGGSALHGQDRNVWPSYKSDQETNNGQQHAANDRAHQQPAARRPCRARRSLNLALPDLRLLRCLQFLRLVSVPISVRQTAFFQAAFPLAIAGTRPQAARPPQRSDGCGEDPSPLSIAACMAAL